MSTTPLQALNMLNGDFLLDQAERFAERVDREAGSDPQRRLPGRSASPSAARPTDR